MSKLPYDERPLRHIPTCTKYLLEYLRGFPSKKQNCNPNNVSSITRHNGLTNFDETWNIDRIRLGQSHRLFLSRYHESETVVGMFLSRYYVLR